MVRQTIGAIGFAVVVFASALAHAAFPVPTGTCTGSICTFNNDLIETRTFGTTGSPEFMVIDNMNANTEFGQDVPPGVDRVRRNWGDGFRLELNRRTTERLYVANDSAVINQSAYDTARAKYDTNTTQIGIRQNQIAQNEADVAAKRAQIRDGVSASERAQLRAEIQALNRATQQANRQVRNLNSANAKQIRKAEDAMVFGGTLMDLNDAGINASLDRSRVSLQFPNSAVGDTNSFVAFTYESRLVDRNGNVYTGFGVVSQTNLHNFGV